MSTSCTPINSCSHLSVAVLINSYPQGEHVGSRLCSGSHLPNSIRNVGPKGERELIDCFHDILHQFSRSPSIPLSTSALQPSYPPLFWNVCSLSSSISAQPLFLYPSPELMLDVTPWEPSCVDMTCVLSPCPGERGSRCSSCTLSHRVPHSACTVLGGAQELFTR